MVFLFRNAVFTLLITLISGSVSAAPYIDEVLKRHLSVHATDASPVTVIATFINLEPLPNIPHRLDNRGLFEVALKRNAAKSQAVTLGLLKDLAQTNGGGISTESIWLTNSLIVRLPSNQLGVLLKDSNITGLFGNRLIKIQPPLLRRPHFANGDEYTYGLTKLQIPELRGKMPQSNGENVRVGILDTGIDSAHPDLKGRVSLWKDFVNDATSPMDDHGHGTHVAGTISGGNASGTWIGIAPKVKLIVGKVFDQDGSATLEGIMKAMQWVADPDGNPATNDGPMLVSNSWGGGKSSSSKDPATEPFCRAVSGWVKLGIVPVFAAGNEGPSAQTVGLPAACPDAVAVAATDDKDVVAKFSSRGPVVWKTGPVQKPVVAAPGVDVLSSLPGGKYEAWSGTSMATPHVAGVTALIWQIMPKATVEEIEKLLISGVEDQGTKGNDPDYGWGRINAFNSLKGTLNYSRTGSFRP